MRQGLSSAEDCILLIKTKPKQTTKTTMWGKDAAGNLTGWSGKDRAGSGHNQRTYDDEMPQDYKQNGVHTRHDNIKACSK